MIYLELEVPVQMLLLKIPLATEFRLADEVMVDFTDF